MRARPEDITKIVNTCVQNDFCYAENITIKDDNRFISFPYCTKNNFICEYAGQHVGSYIVCDGKLKQERDNEEKNT